MKKIIILFILTGIFSACGEEFLETSPKGTLLSSVYFKTEDQVTESLIATYDVLGHQKGYGLSWSDYLVMVETMSDDAFAGGQDAGDGAEADEFNTFSISSANAKSQSIWKRNYYGIYRANFTIKNAEALENTTEEFKAGIIAECKFLRAYFYFEQVRFFENVVLTLEPQSPSEANVPQVSPGIVYNQIAADLVDAIAVLPESPVTGGRATKWAAKALLGRVYLFENGVYGAGLSANGTAIDNAYVLAELEDIIANSGHALLTDYASVFTEAEEFGVESVFEVSYAGEPVQGDWGSEQYVEGNLGAQMMGPRIAGSTIFYRGWAFAIPSHKLYLAMNGDPRQSLTIMTQADLLAETGTSLNRASYQYTGYYNAKYTTRFADRGTVGTPELHNKTNYRAIRFADVLLMAAELGNNVAHINTVRDRVGLAPIAVYSEDALFNERRMELSGEGHRYYDLMRRGQLAAEITQSGIIGPNYTGPAEAYSVTYDPATRGFIPIPQTEIDLSNGVLVQNEGY